MRNDINTRSGYGRVINLSDRTDEESFEMAKGSDTFRIRIQGKIEHTLRKTTDRVSRNTILYILKSINSKSKEIMENMDTSGKFERKFSEEQIEQMAWMLPKDKKITIPYVQEYFSMFDLSWRQAKRIIEKEGQILSEKKLERARKNHNFSL